MSVVRSLRARTRCSHSVAARSITPTGSSSASATMRRSSSLSGTKLEVITVDALVEGVHFDRRFTPPAAIGHRALAVNLSDLAAMGAEPRWALLSLALPPALPCADFDGMIDGLAALARRHRVHVARREPHTIHWSFDDRHHRGWQRETPSSPPTERRPARRSGLRHRRDRRGGRGVGTAVRQTPSASDSCVSRYLQPEPRVREGLLIARNRAATACMDLSDGLADGLHRIAEASGVGMTIDADLLPLTRLHAHGSTHTAATPSDTLLTGGDDYELVFTARPNRAGRLKALRLHGTVPFTKIGVCARVRKRDTSTRERGRRLFPTDISTSE